MQAVEAETEANSENSRCDDGINANDNNIRDTPAAGKCTSSQIINAARGMELEKTTADLYQELESDYFYNSKEVDFLSLEAIANSYVPLVSSRSTKSEMEASIRKCGKTKTSIRFPVRLTSLAILTDQVVASAISPSLTNWDVTQKSLVRQLEILGREWFQIFKDCYMTCSLSKLCLENISIFLHRQYNTLQKSSNNNIYERNLASVFFNEVNKLGFSDRVFWSKSLISIDGRENPSRKRKHSSSDEEMKEEDSYKKMNFPPDTSEMKVKTGSNHFNQKQLQIPFTKIKKPSTTHVSLQHTPRTKLELKVPLANNNNSQSNPKNTVKRVSLPVKEFFISNFQCSTDKMAIKCWVVSRHFQIDFHVDNGNIYVHSFKREDLNSVIFCPEEGSLFLFLSDVGTTRMIRIFESISQIPKHCLKKESSAVNKKLVVKFEKKMLNIPNLKGKFFKIFKEKLDVKYAEVIQTFGKLLYLNVVDFNRAFVDPGVRTLETTVVNKIDVGKSFKPEEAINWSQIIANKIVKELVENVLNEKETNAVKKKRSISDIFTVGRDEFIDLTRSASGGAGLDDRNNIVDLTRSDSTNSICECDDCLFITSAHKRRILTGKYKCRCHPCMLRVNVLKERKTDPFSIIKLDEFKGAFLSYWNQPWVNDMFSDLMKEKMTMDMAIKLTGTSLMKEEFLKFQAKQFE